MFKVNVMYPYAEGARFDHAYYRDTHMPLVAGRLGDACEYYTVEKGLSGTSADGNLPMWQCVLSSANPWKPIRPRWNSMPLKFRGILPITLISCRWCR